MNAVQLFTSGLIFGWFLGVVSLIFLVRAYFEKSFKMAVDEIYEQYNKILKEYKRENDKLKQKITCD